MESFLIDAEILTPIIMAGAETALPEIRTQSIKGLLRWWYRFYKSSLVNSLDELKKAEAEIWGSTDKASLIKLQILSKPDSTQYAHLCMNDQRTKPPASKPYQAVEKVIFSQTRSWANKSKILSAGLPEANRIVFEK